MLLFERNCRLNTHKGIFEIDYPLSPCNYLEIIKTTRKQLWLCNVLAPYDVTDCAGSQFGECWREEICIEKMETALNYQCLTLCVQCLFCLSVSCAQGKILSYQHDKDVRKRGRKHCPGPEEWIKGLHSVFSIFSVVFPPIILFSTWGR